MSQDIGLYTIAGWTLEVMDAHLNLLVATSCRLSPRGLFIATDNRDHGIAKGGRVLIRFCSGDLRFELGATVSVLGWCPEISAEGIGLRLDRLCPDVVGAFLSTPGRAAC